MRDKRLAGGPLPERVELCPSDMHSRARTSGWDRVFICSQHKGYSRRDGCPFSAPLSHFCVGLLCVF